MIEHNIQNIRNNQENDYMKDSVISTKKTRFANDALGITNHWGMNYSLEESQVRSNNGKSMKPMLYEDSNAYTLFGKPLSEKVSELNYGLQENDREIETSDQIDQYLTSIFSAEENEEFLYALSKKKNMNYQTNSQKEEEELFSAYELKERPSRKTGYNSTCEFETTEKDCEPDLVVPTLSMETKRNLSSVNNHTFWRNNNNRMHLDLQSDKELANLDIIYRNKIDTQKLPHINQSFKNMEAIDRNLVKKDSHGHTKGCRDFYKDMSDSSSTALYKYYEETPVLVHNFYDGNQNSRTNGPMNTTYENTWDPAFLSDSLKDHNSMNNNNSEPNSNSNNDTNSNSNSNTNSNKGKQDAGNHMDANLDMKDAVFNLYVNLLNYMNQAQNSKENKVTNETMDNRSHEETRFDYNQKKEFQCSSIDSSMYEGNNNINFALSEKKIRSSVVPNENPWAGESRIPNFPITQNNVVDANMNSKPKFLSSGYMNSMNPNEYNTLQNYNRIVYNHNGYTDMNAHRSSMPPQDSSSAAAKNKTGIHIIKKCIIDLIEYGEEDLNFYECIIKTISAYIENKISSKNSSPMMNNFVNNNNLQEVMYEESPMNQEYMNANNQTRCISSDIGTKNMEQVDHSMNNNMNKGSLNNPLDYVFPFYDGKMTINESGNTNVDALNGFPQYAETSLKSLGFEDLLADEKIMNDVLLGDYYKSLLKNKNTNTESEEMSKLESTRKKYDDESMKYIENEMFETLRDRKSSTPQNLDSLKGNQNTNSCTSDDGFINGEFVMNMKNVYPYKMNLSMGSRGTAEIRSVNKNLGNFFKPDNTRTTTPISNGDDLPSSEKKKSIYDSVRTDNFNSCSTKDTRKFENAVPNSLSYRGLSFRREGISKYHTRDELKRGYTTKEKLKGSMISQYNSLPTKETKLTHEELRPLITKEDKLGLERLLQSLYDDRILPLEFNLKGRVEEIKMRDLIKNNLLTAYELYPKKYRIEVEGPKEHSVFFADRKVEDDYFVYLNNLDDKYDKEMWVQFEEYLKTIGNSDDPSMYEFSGGRYGMAKELQKRNLPFFKGLYLGHICHIIHLSTNKKLIAYEQKMLKPIWKCHKHMNAKLGILSTQEKDSENFITSIKELRYYMNELLKYYKGGFNISTLKKKLKTKFNKRICESVFHCIKLIDVLQLDELKDICVVDKELKFVKSERN